MTFEYNHQELFIDPDFLPKNFNEQLSMAVCLNGHQIFDHVGNETTLPKYCDKCGKLIIDKCPNCHAIIPGHKRSEELSDRKFPKMATPMFCINCGNPYPWTEKIISGTEQILKLDDISGNELSIVKEELPNIFSKDQTISASSVASIAKLKPVFLKVSSKTKPVLKEMLQTLVTEGILKLLGF
ncbi:MAG: DUF2321 domain-containing protein [Oenococcus oeni]